MLHLLIKNALQHRTLVLLVGLGLALSGMVISTQVAVDVFPDLTAPTVTVMTEAEGMTAEEMERLVTFPLETALNGAHGVWRIRSASIAGLSSLKIEFEWGTDIYRARQIVSERINAVQLPKKVDDPVMAPIASIMGEVQMIGLASDSLSPMELHSLAYWSIQPRLLAIKGVSKVVIYGGEEREYQIQAHPERLKFHHVTLDELHHALSQLNQNASGGYIEQYGKQYLVSTKGRIQRIQDIEQALVKMDGHIAVRVADVATVQLGAAPQYGKASINAQDAITLTILKQPDANTLELTQRIEAALQELAPSFPPSVRLYPKLFQQGNFIATAIDNLQGVLLEGILCVMVVLFFFLMEWRTTLISILTIPLSLLISIILLYVLGFSINTMTLGGLAIAVGVLVDDAIVDVENVYKRLRQNAALSRSEQQPSLTIIYQATFEVRASILNSSLIIMASFIPLFFLESVEGRLLQPLGWAFLIVIVVSLLVAIVVTPALCSFLLKTDALLSSKNSLEPSAVVRRLAAAYHPIVEGSLGRIPWIFGVAGLLLVIALVVLLNLGRSFLPDFNEGSLTIEMVTTPETSLSQTHQMGQQIERLLLELPEVQLIGRRTGRASMDEHAQSHYRSEIEVPLTMMDRPKAAVLAAIRTKVDSIPGVSINIGQPISHRIDHMISGTRANIALKLFGQDLTTMTQLGHQIQQHIQRIPGVVDVSLDHATEIPHIYIYPKKELLARSGITIEQFSEFVEVAVGGKVLFQVYEQQRSYNLTLRLATEHRDELEDLRSLTIENYEGVPIPFEKVAHIQSSSSPERINRENVQRLLTISANVAERDVRSVVQDIRERLATTIEFPTGYYLEYSGQFESEERATQRLLWAALLAIALIFGLLWREFKDWRLASIILLNLPLALIGGVLMVAFTSGILSVASTIGFISLFGIATRNGMLLIARYQVLLQQGLPLKEAIVTGSLDRLNPILMTATTTGLALIPLILAGGQAGNEIQSPMAVVIVGGLISSTLLNLVVVPCAFYALQRNKHLLKTNICDQ